MNYPNWLGLKREEKLILSVIAKRGSLSVSEISRKTKIPRTTIYNYIKPLSVRGLVTTEKKGRENLIVPKYNHNNFWSQSSEEFNISGGEDFIKIYTLIQKNKNLTRIRWIQPAGVLKIITEKYSIGEIIQVNNMIKKSEAVIECILDEDYYQTLQKSLSDNGFNRITNSLYGRPYEAYLIKKDVLDPYTEILLLGKGVIILNWKYLQGIYTQNKAVNLFFESYFNGLKNKSNKINISEVIANYFAKN
jgi:DNA-binding transcriptional ArsR family regulator